MARGAKGGFAAASERTRLELLAAGHRLLTEPPGAGVFGALTANRVVAEAGRTTGAFFHQWPTIEDYQRDLIAYVLHPERSSTLETTADALLAELGGGASFTEALVRATRPTVALTARDPQTIVELFAWTRAIHDEVFRADVARHYPDLDAAATGLYGGLLAILGREPRPPFTLELIAGVCNAVAQGLASRQAITPGFYPEDLYGWTLVTLATLMTRDPADDRDAEAFVVGLGLEPRASESSGLHVDAHARESNGD